MKSLFVHIPKNMGMSIRRGIPGRVMLAAPGRHISNAYTETVRQVMTEAGEHPGFEHARIRDWSKDLRARFPAVAIIRNPWERTVSRYMFARQHKDPSGDQTFIEFLEERNIYGGLEYYWHRAIRGWYPQKDYVVNEKGNLVVNCLRHGTDDYCHYFGLKRRLPERNVTNTQGYDWREFYGPDEYKIVANWYADDINFFSFTFTSHARANIWKPS